MNKELHDYLEKEWKFNNHKKYYKYFTMWVKNLIESQIYYFRKQMMKSQK
jgi:hypothetical protein